MKYFANGGFYDSDVHTTIPDGAVEISDELYQSLMESQAVGKRITSGEDGLPVAVDQDPAPPELLARFEAERVRDGLLTKAAAISVGADDDATALALSPVCPEWQAGTRYESGEIVNRNGQPYRVVQTVDTIESQPPDADGMLAVYRPLNTGNAGTADDPIPYVYGMDVYSGKYYSFNGKTYLAKSDMTPCVWDPGTAGLWQWELVA